MTEEQIRDALRHHPPTEAQAVTFNNIRHWMSETAVRVADAIPDGRERSLFLTHFETAQMWANKAVALKGPRTEHNE